MEHDDYFVLKIYKMFITELNLFYLLLREYLNHLRF